MTKLMTTIKLSKKINTQMLQDIITQGYGMRGKSKWIIEAINAFLQLPNFHELVDIASEMEELSEVVSLRLTESLVHQLDEAVICVRKHYPAIEGVKSNIIRASIIQRLLRQY